MNGYYYYDDTRDDDYDPFLCSGTAGGLCGVCRNPGCGVDPTYAGFVEFVFWTWGLYFAFMWVGAFTHFMACRSFAYTPQSKEKLKAWHTATRSNANNVKICIWIPCLCICIWGWCWAHIFLNLTMLSAHLYIFCARLVDKPVKASAAWCRRLDAVRRAPHKKGWKSKQERARAAESALKAKDEAKGVDVEMPVVDIDLDIDLDIDIDFELDIPRYPWCRFFCNMGRLECGFGIGDVLRVIFGFLFRLLYACASISIVWVSLGVVMTLPDFRLPSIRIALGFWGFWHDLTIPFSTLDIFDWSAGANGCLSLQVLLKNSMMCFVIGVVAIVAGTHLTTLFGTRMKAFARMYPQIPLVGQICGGLPKASGYALKSSVTAVSATAVFMLSNFFNFRVFLPQCGVGWVTTLAASLGIGAAFTVLNWMSMWIYAGGLNKYDDAVRLVTGGIDPMDSEAMNAYLQKAVSSTGWFSAAMRGFYHTFLLMIGVWPKSMIEHLGIARIGAENDPEPYNPKTTPFRAILRHEAASMGLLWYMVPGCQIFGEYIQQANDPPIYVAPDCGIKLHGNPRNMKAKYCCNMLQVTCQILVALSASAFFMWMVALLCLANAILDLSAVIPALSRLFGETLETLDVDDAGGASKPATPTTPGGGETTTTNPLAQLPATPKEGTPRSPPPAAMSPAGSDAGAAAQGV